MTTKREQIFEALFTALGDIAGVELKRNDALPERLDDGSKPLLVQQDGGNPPDPEIVLSPVSYTYDETVKLEIAVQEADGREAAADAIVAGVGTILAASRTLGGLADDVRSVKPPLTDDRDVPGGATLRVATIEVQIQYTTSDPLA